MGRQKQTSSKGAPSGAPVSSSLSGTVIMKALQARMSKSSNAEISIMGEDGSVITTPKFLSTGHPGLDSILGGGIPAGRIAEIYSKNEGEGKCYRVGTKVLMVSGITRVIEDVRVGDQLVGPDGLPRTVIDVTRGRGPLYRVTPSRSFAKETFDVTANHLLPIRFLKTGSNPGFVPMSVSVQEYLTWSSTKQRHAAGYKCSVPVAFTGLMLGDTYLPFYLLGLWLADGTCGKNAITFNQDDTELLQWAETWAKDNGYSCSVFPKKDSKGVTVRYVTPRGKSNPFLDWLRRVALDDVKHIPAHYLQARSIRSRMDLLAGLLDGDGYLDRSRHQFEIVQKSEALAHDIVFLARSLGFATKLGTKFVDGVPYYRIYIRGAIENIPLVLPRKRPQIRQPKNPPHHFRMGIEPIGEDDYVGLTVDGDQKFLLADFTVGHNSSIAGHLMAEMQRKGGNVILIDAEQGFTMQRLQQLGVDPATVIYVEPDHIESVFDVITSVFEVIEDEEDTALADHTLIVWDSVAATPSKQQFEADYDQQTMGAQARALSSGLQKLIKTLKRHEVYFVLLNQIRHKIGAMFGEQTQTSGGKAVKFYASTRLELSKPPNPWLKVDNDVVGFKITAKTIKSRIVRPFQTTTLYLHFERGVDAWKGLFDLCEEAGIIKKKGAYVTITGYAKEDGTLKSFRQKDFQKIVTELGSDTQQLISDHLVSIGVTPDAIRRFFPNVQAKQKGT